VLELRVCCRLRDLPRGLQRDLRDHTTTAGDLPEPLVDTADPALATALLAALPRLDGLLLLGDNAHGLRLLEGRFAGAVQCAYADPPFNTESDGFAYADRRPRAAWLCFVEERVALLKTLLAGDGSLYVHIDQHEKERLRLLLDDHLEYQAELIWSIGWLSGFKTRAKKFIRNHDTIYQYARGKRPLFNKRYLPIPRATCAATASRRPGRGSRSRTPGIAAPPTGSTRSRS